MQTTNPEILGEAGANPKARFHYMFQREVEEHDQDLEKKYDEDLNTTLIFSGLFSAVASAFIIDIQSELSPDYEQANNVLLEMLLNATTGTLPPNSAASIPRWNGPDPVVVQVQCILYATLCAALLAAFLAMLGKQWLSRYKENETRGSAADRSRLRERKLTGIGTWKLHLVLESLPLILQFALFLLGFALSRYLWEVNSSVSSAVIAFTGFGFLFYLSIVTASVFSFDCPFQTPFSLLIRYAVRLTTPYLRNLRHTFGSIRQSLQPGVQQAGIGLPLSIFTVSRGHDSRTALTPITTQPPWPITPLFVQGNDLEGDRLDAKCVNILFEMSTDIDVVVSNMDFIPEIIWHGGIKDVPRKRIYDILIDCFDFSGADPVVVPKSRSVAYLSARAFVHIELQRRCIVQYEDHERNSWEALCANHRPLLSANNRFDPDLEAVLFMVDMALGYNNGFSWAESKMTLPHRAWMSHVLLYHACHERQVPEVVLDFVENSLSLESTSNAVIADCFFIIGLTIGVSFHVNDILVKDKRSDLNLPWALSSADPSPSSYEMGAIIGSVFEAFERIFSSDSVQNLSAIRALQLATLISGFGVCDVSYRLFKTIMALDLLTDEHWEASRLAIYAAFHHWEYVANPGNPKEILKFLDYHVCFLGAEEEHDSYIMSALIPLVRFDGPDLLTFGCARDFDWTSPSFVRGVCSMMEPRRLPSLKAKDLYLVALLSDSWFHGSAPALKPEDMSKFCEGIASHMDKISHVPLPRKAAVTVLFGMLCSPEWRRHIPTRFWRVLAYCTQAYNTESARWCLQNAIELLEFTRGLPDGEGLKWWCGTLWLCYNKLDTTVRDEVKQIAAVMLRDDGLSDLNLYLSLMQEELKRIQQELNALPDETIGRGPPGREIQARLITMEGNYDQLARIAGRR
ncbi:hypothetical protein BJ322DRAFT_1113791 [Thelephora terrestris]|uniref:DUF6535 domain-containing protein n=1 Tax=Thelephora terrestris TaxID=56493 RepID=A0A9P6L270_9AGAM|nr:hypothetical protein BJ322DRAFT_1113791 [Thelephora terrestris]